MTTLNKLLDKAREVCKSDSAIAARLKVTRSAVSKWRHGGKIEAVHVAALIELAQQDPALVVQIMQEQEGAPAEHRMWSALWDRLSPVTTVIGVCLLAFGMSANTAEIKHFSGDTTPRMYIMSIVLTWLRGLRQVRSALPWRQVNA